MTTSCRASGWLCMVLSSTEVIELSLGAFSAGSCSSTAQPTGEAQG